jgi:calcineurin-like phosphoesterase family protein
MAVLKLNWENKNIWITSDTHYNHKNICRGVTNWRLPDGSIPENQTRDFSSLDKMNQVIVDNINDVVGQDDVLIHLGDWSFGGFEFIKLFRDRIICQNIHLVLGNHDHHIERNRDNIQSLFSSVNDYVELNVGNHQFVLSHYPMSSWNGMNKGWIHLHGHVHLSPDKKFGRGKKMDVGMDGNDLEPYNIKREILSLMDKRPISSDMLFDHHLDEIVNKDKG